MAKKIRHYRMRTGTWAFALHRLSGLGLVAYLPLHILVTGTIRTPGGFDRYMASFDNPLFHFLEWGLVGIVIYHSLNGLRVVALDAGWMSDLQGQKRLFWALVGAGAAAWLVALPVMMGWTR